MGIRFHKLDDIFRSELGANPQGGPVYCWQQASALVTTMLDCEFSNGQYKPIVEWKANDAGILVPTPKTRIERMAFWLKPDQWTLTIWNFVCHDAEANPDLIFAVRSIDERRFDGVRVAESAWRAMYHDLLEPPKPGWYSPCDDAYLEPGEYPTEGHTWAMVALIKKQRQKSFKDWIAQTEEGLRKQEAINDAYIDGEIEESLTAFGNIPGSRASAISLPTKESRLGHDKVFTNERVN